MKRILGPGLAIAALAHLSACTVQNRRAAALITDGKTQNSLFSDGGTQALAISPPSATLERGGTQQFIALGTTSAVTWVKESGDGFIDASGKYTHNSLDAGTTVIRAQTSGGLTARAEIKISNPGDSLQPPEWAESKFDVAQFTPDAGRRATIQQDGKIVVAGDSEHNGGAGGIALIRMTTAGVRDQTFGTTAGDRPGATLFVKLNPNTSSRIPSILLTAPNGNIILGGNCLVNGTSGTCLVQIRPDGTLNTAFGSGGYAFVPYGYIIRAGAIQPDGKIVIVGQHYRNVNGQSLLGPFAMRLQPNGSLDSGGFNAQSENNPGAAMLPANNPDGSPSIGDAVGVAILPDGKIYIAAEVSFEDKESHPRYVTIYRLTAAGNLDTDSATGYGPLNATRTARPGLSKVDFGAGLVVQPKQVLVGANDIAIVACTVYEAQTQNQKSQVGILWLRPDGSPDPDYGSASNPGKVRLFVLQKANDQFLSFARQTDGKLIVAALTNMGSDGSAPYAPVVYRLTSSGRSFDSRWSKTGVNFLQFDPSDSPMIHQIAMTRPTDPTPAQALVIGTNGERMYVQKLRN